MKWITLLLFALALNMDSFTTGISYGLRHIRIPFKATLLISLISAATITVSMHIGHLISWFISTETARYMGAAMLLLLGIRVTYQGWRKSQQELPPTKPDITRVLNEPQSADLDFSGDISTLEACFLGTALALDAFAAGIAISMIGFDALLTALVVGINNLLMIYSGIWAGKWLGTLSFFNRIAALPGYILIAIGLLKFIGR